MPQMSPLWWLLLFIMFSATLILFILMNYFMTITKPSEDEDSSTLEFKYFAWKW